MKIGIDPDAPPVFLTPVSVERFPLMGADGYATRHPPPIQSIIYHSPVFRYGINILGVWCEVERDGERCTSGRLRVTSVSGPRGTDIQGELERFSCN